jgi:hypothetical protein
MHIISLFNCILLKQWRIIATGFADVQELLIEYLTKVTAMETEPKRQVGTAAAAGDGADAATREESDGPGAGNRDSDGTGAGADSNGDVEADCDGDGDGAASSQAEPAAWRGRTPAAGWKGQTAQARRSGRPRWAQGKSDAQRRAPSSADDH